MGKFLNKETATAGIGDKEAIVVRPGGLGPDRHWDGLFTNSGTEKHWNDYSGVNEVAMVTVTIRTTPQIFYLLNSVKPSNLAWISADKCHEFLLSFPSIHLSHSYMKIELII